MNDPPPYSASTSDDLVKVSPKLVRPPPQYGISSTNHRSPPPKYDEKDDVKEDESEDEEFRILRDTMISEKEEEEEPSLQKPLLVRSPSYFTVRYTKPLTDAVAEAAKRARDRRVGPRPSKRRTRIKRVKRLDPFPRFMTIEICTMSGRSLEIEMNHDVKVIELKRCISDSMMDWPVNRQRIFFKGETLKYPHSTLKRNGIMGRKVTLYIVKALRTDDAEIQELPESMKARPERITAQSESYRCITCGSVPCPMAIPGHICDICRGTSTTYRCPNRSCDFDLCNNCWEQGARVFIKMRKDIAAIWMYHEGGSKGYRTFLAEDSRYLEMRYHSFLFAPTTAPSVVTLQVAGVATYSIDFKSMTQTNVASNRKRGLARRVRDDNRPIPPAARSGINSFQEIFPNRTPQEIFLVMSACHGDFDSTCAFLAS